ncbi:MAG TPA: DUF3465 domain-containing protein [Kiritimatiellia bacterium]|jgi:hypothetical protein|nr:MAG: hypothetical protein BWX70_01424 [Verrucomicrobia bacterium ADurb.Bin070]HQL50978.1 DUF3465 domain-containing protein [Kiritimatiellia bacterium]
MRKLLILGAMLLAGHLYFGVRQGPAPVAAPVSTGVSPSSFDTVFADAYANRRSNIQVSGEGTVTKLLPDDNTGSRHQKFIVRLASGQTLLVAHNIDVAPRIGALRAGDRVQFSGEYEWSDRGGLVHWTHRTASGPHPGGWLRHGGRTYQ